MVLGCLSMYEREHDSKEMPKSAWSLIFSRMGAGFSR